MHLDEEPLDRWVNRPLAKLAARALQPTPISANAVSVFSGLLGGAAGAAMGLGTTGWLVGAALFLWGQLVFDCADGELARLRGGGGKSGMVVDGFADYFVAIAIHIGFWVLALKSPAFAALPRWSVGVMVVATALSMALHSPLFDAAKQQFRVVLGKSAPWLSENSAAYREELARVTSSWDRLILRVYHGYAGSQRFFAGWAGSPTFPTFLAWCVLGPTLRVSVLAVTLVVSIRAPHALAFYPIFGLGACNVVMLLLVLTARRPSPSAAPGSSRP